MIIRKSIIRERNIKIKKIIIGISGILLLNYSSFAFNYIEHSYLTDKACTKAQLFLAQQIQEGRRELVSKYLALSLFCPVTWEKHYCKNDYKQVYGQINATYKKSIENGEYSVTLGDISAITDHTKEFGAIKMYPRASREGLLSMVVEWLKNGDDGADGYLEDVAEDACETENLVNWETVDDDIDQFFNSKYAFSNSDYIPSNRSFLKKGPSDPAGLYSFDNPQYLDFVLKNHHHFGRESYSAWLGFHTAAVDISQKGCAMMNSTDVSCRDIVKGILRRLQSWEGQASRNLVEPVTSDLLDIKQNSKLQNQVSADLLSLVFEGVGLHFLQDNYSGGHLRVVREAYNLEDSRFYHDYDSWYGLSAKQITATKTRPFVAFGDDYLLGKNEPLQFGDCSKKRDKSKNASCLLQYQRGMLVASTTASLLDWAQGGTRFEDAKCSKKNLDKFVCDYLPTSPVLIAGEVEPKPQSKIEYGDLPQPQPGFSYQSLLISNATDPKLQFRNLGVRLQFLSALGDEATWLKSYNFGYYRTHTEDFNQQHLEFSFMFHWRWAARFLINMSPYVEVADESTSLSRRSKVSIGPVFGVTFLPEGWIRLPLEITILWKAPREIYSTKEVIGHDIQNVQWLELSFGLSIF